MHPEKICPKCGSNNVKKVSIIYNHFKNKESVKEFLGYDPEEYSYENILKDVGVRVAGYELSERTNVEDAFKYQEFAPPEDPDLKMKDGTVLTLTLDSVFCSIAAIVGSVMLGFGVFAVAKVAYVLAAALFFSGLIIFKIHDVRSKNLYYKHKKAFDIWNKKYFCNECQSFFFG